MSQVLPTVSPSSTDSPPAPATEAASTVVREPAPRPPVAAAAPNAEPGAALLVWLVWLVLLADLFRFTANYGHNVPTGDEWSFVRWVAGERPVTLEWLWSQHNEHRIPLAKVIMVGLFRLSGGDYRAVMYFNVVLLGGIAAAMIWCARRWGGNRYSDMFIPLLWLNRGHCSNLLTNLGVAFIAFTALACAMLLLILRHRTPPPVRAGCLLVLMFGWGGNGLVFMAPLALWLGYCGLRALFDRTPSSRRHGLILLGFALVGLALFGLYFVGYRNPHHHADSPSVRASLLVAVEMLSTCFGPAGESFWPLSGVLAVAALVACAAAMALIWWRRPAERERAFGLLMFLGAFGVLALGAGWSRAGIGETAGLAPRYMTLAAPLLACVYFIARIYAGRWGTFIGMVFFTLLCATLFLNNQVVTPLATERHKKAEELQQMIRSGAPAIEVAHHFARPRYGFTASPAQLSHLLLVLHRYGVGPFQQLHGAYDGQLRPHPRPDIIFGYAWDETQPNTPIAVDICDGQKVIATVQADQYRKGLENQNIGDGKHAFEYRLPAKLLDGARHDIRVRYAETRFELRNSPRTVVLTRKGK
jgi:hypothetical protein